MLKVGLIGFSQGYYAVNYTRYLERIKNIEIIGISDCGRSNDYVQECAFLTAQEFAQQIGTPLFHDYIELLDKKPDAVLICSETCEHVSMAKEALHRGINTFVSKPLSFCSNEISQMFKHKPKDVSLLCGNPLKYEQGIEQVKQCIEQGKIGKVYSVHIMINHLAMVGQEWERDPKRSGGPLGTYGIYLIDLVRWITGREFAAVYAMGDNYCMKEIDSWDTVKAVARLDDGTMCSLELFSAIKHNFPFVQLELVGERGTLTTQYDNYSILIQTETSNELGALRNDDMGAAEMEHFLDCIQYGQAERCSVQDMFEVAKVIEAIVESIGSGTEIQLRREEL